MKVASVNDENNVTNIVGNEEENSLSNSNCGYNEISLEPNFKQKESNSNTESKSTENENKPKDKK